MRYVLLSKKPVRHHELWNTPHGLFSAYLECPWTDNTQGGSLHA